MKWNSYNRASAITHAVLNRMGIDVRLLRNIKRAQATETLQQESENWRFLKNHCIDSVLDVGANEGQFAQLIRRVCPDSLVWSFEPLPDVFGKLVEQTRSDPAIHPFNLALSDRNAEVCMNQSEFSPSSSLLSMAQLHREEWPHSVRHKEVLVKLVRLDDWVSDNGVVVGPGTLLKADVQGHELSVLKGGEKTLRNVGVAVIEVEFYELYEKQPLFSEIHAMMESLGFRYRGNVEQHYSRKSDQILFADAIFENVKWEAKND